MMVRVALRVNEAGQGLFRLIQHLGPTAYQTAVLLADHEFDITRAALTYGLRKQCPRCATPIKQEALRGCNACVTAMRQRVHRLQDRVQHVLLDKTPGTRHRRPVVMFGADRARFQDGETVYDRASASDEVAEGAEGSEL